MTEILSENDEKIYVQGDKRYRIYFDVPPHYPGEGTKYGANCEVWSMEFGWKMITRINRPTKKEGFADALKFLIAFHDGE